MRKYLVTVGMVLVSLASNAQLAEETPIFVGRTQAEADRMRDLYYLHQRKPDPRRDVGLSEERRRRMEEDRQTAVKAKWRAFLGIPTPQSEIDRQTMIEKERQAYDQACYEYGDHNIRVQPNGQIVYKTNDQYWIQAKDGTWMTKRKRGR